MSLIVLVALTGFSHFVTYSTLAWALESPNKHIPGPKIAPPQTFLLQLPNREWESFWVHKRAQAKARGGREESDRGRGVAAVWCDSSLRDPPASSAQSMPGQHSQPQLLAQRATSLQLTLHLFPAPHLSLFPQQNGH